MPRLISLNLNHRTRPVAVARSLLDVCAGQRPDILVFNEYVHQPPASSLQQLLGEVGFPHVAISDSVEYRTGRWQNQVLIASNRPIDCLAPPTNAPDTMYLTNMLSVRTHGMTVTGLRAPAYTAAGDWYRYWDWLADTLGADVAIGDFNADPGRARKWDRVLATLTERGSWSRPEIRGDWSYKGTNGSRSKVDHVLVKNRLTVCNARYVTEGIVPTHTDHAALVADVSWTDEYSGPDQELQEFLL